MILDRLGSRLYWRIALYIGAAIAAFVPLGIASVALVASHEFQDYSATRHSTLGREAAQALARGGRGALVQWLARDARIPQDVSVYILDESSQDILGRSLPKGYGDFIRKYVVGEPTAPADSYQPIRLAPQLLGSNGDRYAFLVMPRNAGWWGSPATIAGIVFAALLVIASVAWLIARAINRPIGELQIAVRSLASGHVQARAPAAIVARRDEVGALAADFNSMANQIEALLRGREELMRELSHELRSPLARMQAAVALIDQRQALRPTDRESIERDVARMNQVIGDLLRYSRLDSAAQVQRRLLRVNVLLAEIVQEEEVEASSHGCRLRTAIDDDLAVVGDPELLRSGLENIIRNAIKYSPRGADVEIRASRLDDDIHIEVLDRGPGVPSGMLESIFEPYFRGPPAATDRSGTGLGLAIARRVFTAHGGTIVARCRTDGGLAIKVTLPAAKIS
ncbi:MAG: HAMP domain-containing sensor histidine kinase [Steroidobacteraceae bacterium]